MVQTAHERLEASINETSDRYRKLTQREYLMTPQEHMLIGSTPSDGKGGIFDGDDPYTPIIFKILEKLDISLVNAQRARLCPGKSLADYFGLETEDRLYVATSIEPLDENGDTIRDPVPLTKKGKPMKNGWRYSSDFPYGRN